MPRVERAPLHIAILGLAVFLTGCYEGDTVCNAEARPGLVIEIRDSLSGAGRAPESMAIAAEGEFADTLRNFGDSVHSQGLTERGGTYQLTISTPGYVVWTKGGVVIHEGECHVETLGLVAHLQPAS